MKSTQTLSLVKSKLSSSNLGTHFQRYLHLEDKTLVQTACSVVRKLSMWHNNGSGNTLILSSSPLITARSSPSRADLDETPDLILYDYYQNSKRQQCIVTPELCATIGLSERVRKEEKRRLPLLVLIKELHWISLSLSWYLWFDPSNNRLPWNFRVRERRRPLLFLLIRSSSVFLSFRLWKNKMNNRVSGLRPGQLVWLLICSNGPGSVKSIARDFLRSLSSRKYDPRVLFTE